MENPTHDVFISHASEDKEEIARPLAEVLRARGVRVWLDETEITLGDSLRRSIDAGLARSAYGVVILSRSFFKKEWTQKELDGLVAREANAAKVILPVWHGIGRSEICEYSPPLADKLAISSEKGTAAIADAICRAIEQQSGAPVVPVPRAISRQLDELVVQILDQIQESADYAGQYIVGLPTGFKDLDLLISGLQPGGVTLLAGRPHSGKTSFLSNLAWHASAIEGLPVAVFLANAHADDFTRRMISSSVNISTYGLRSGLLQDEEWPALTEAIEKMVKKPVHFVDEHDLSVLDIESECYRLRELHGAVGLIIVDSLQYLSASARADMIDTVHRFRRLAKELGTAVLSVFDLPAESGRIDPRPLLSDLNGADRYSETVLLMHHFSRDEVDGIELTVAKQRSGPTNAVVHLQCSMRSGQMKDWPYESS